MVTCVENFISVSSRLNSGSELRELFLRAVEAEGYQNAVFAKARDRRLSSIPWNRFPKGYLDEYQASEWDKIDPIVQHIHCARRPFRRRLRALPRQGTRLPPVRPLNVS